MAFGALCVTAEFGEKDADVHLIEVVIEPSEEAIDAIPLAAVFFVGGFAFHDEAALFFIELGPRDVGADFVFFSGALKVA